jgi:hypothetical protein
VTDRFFLGLAIGWVSTLGPLGWLWLVRRLSQPKIPKPDPIPECRAVAPFGTSACIVYLGHRGRHRNAYNLEWEQTEGSSPPPRNRNQSTHRSH